MALHSKFGWGGTGDRARVAAHPDVTRKLATITQFLRDNGHGSAEFEYVTEHMNGRVLAHFSGLESQIEAKLVVDIERKWSCHCVISNDGGNEVVLEVSFFREVSMKCVSVRGISMILLSILFIWSAAQAASACRH